MSPRGSCHPEVHRRHSVEFKLQLCSEIRSGKVGRREATRAHGLSANQLQLWLTQYDQGSLNEEIAAASVVAEYEAKIAALERKVDQPTMEIDLLKKNATLASRERRRDIINHHRPASCYIRGGCEVIALPRNTYYYRSRAVEHGLTDAWLVDLIGDIHDEFPRCGYRRVTLELVARGYCVNYKRIARIMRERALGAIRRRRFVRTTDGDHDNPVFPKRYRDRVPDRPDLTWVADIIYVALTTWFAYVAVILDACSRKVVGCAISRQIDTELTLAALELAVQTRRPEPGICIHHSDRLNPPNIQVRRTVTR